MKRILRGISLILTVVLTTGIFCFNVKADDEMITFTDVTNSGSATYKAVYWAVENGIAQGYEDNTFRPNDPCTRAHFVIFIWRMSGKPEPTKKDSKFSDVSDSLSYYDAICWAIEKDIIRGFSDGTFRPEENITRRQAAIMLWRLAGRPTVASEETSDSQASIFEDISSDDSAFKAITWGNSKKIMKGVSGKFLPDDLCQRQHIVIFLLRYYLLQWDNSGNKVTFPTNPSAAQKLKELGGTLYDAYCWCRDIPFYGSEPDPATVEEYAQFAFDNGKASCLGKNGAFCMMARELGYDAHLVRGFNGPYDHAWVEIDWNGEIIVCDPQAAQRFGRNFFMFRYKTPGTLVYRDWVRLN